MERPAERRARQELEAVRERLQLLVVARSTRGLTPEEQREYDELTRLETDLLGITSSREPPG